MNCAVRDSGWPGSSICCCPTNIFLNSRLCPTRKQMTDHHSPAKKSRGSPWLSLKKIPGEFCFVLSSADSSSEDRAPTPNPFFDFSFFLSAFFFFFVFLGFFSRLFS